MLKSKELEAFGQRIKRIYSLNSLNYDETREYIFFRLIYSDATGSPVFEDDAIKLIHNLSRGVPRLINNVCDNCLLLAASKRLNLINLALVNKITSNGNLIGLKEIEEAKDDSVSPEKITRTSGDKISLTEDIVSSKKYANRASTEADGRYEDDKFEDDRYEDDRYEDDRYEDDRYEDDRYEDDRYEDDRYEDGRYENDRYEDDRYEDGRYEDGRYEDGRYEDDRYEDGRYKDDKFEDDKFEDDRYKDDRYRNDRYRNDRYKNDRYKNDRYKNDRYNDAYKIYNDSDNAGRTENSSYKKEKTYAFGLKNSKSRQWKTGILVVLILIILFLLFYLFNQNESNKIYNLQSSNHHSSNFLTENLYTIDNSKNAKKNELSQYDVKKYKPILVN